MSRGRVGNPGAGGAFATILGDPNDNAALAALLAGKASAAEVNAALALLAPATVYEVVTGSRALTAADIGKVLVNDGPADIYLTNATGIATLDPSSIGFKRNGSGQLFVNAGPTLIYGLPGVSVPRNDLDVLQWISGDTWNYLPGGLGGNIACTPLTTRDMTPADWGTQLVASASCTLTIKPSSLAGVSPGSRVDLTQGATGTLTVVGSGVPVLGSLAIAARGTITLQLMPNGEVWVRGNLATVAGNVATTISSNPVITGTPQVGVAGSYTPALANGTPTPTFVSRQHQVSADGSTGWTNGAGTGATGANYTPAVAEGGKYLSVQETWTNSGGSATARSAPVLIAAAGGFAPVYSNLRMGTLASGAVESGDGSAGWNYSVTSGADYASRVSNPSLNLAAGVDGSVSATLASVVGNSFIGFDDVGTAQLFSAWAYGLYSSTSASYQVVVGGASTTPNANSNGLTPSVGDQMRLRRAGDEVIAEVKKVSTSTWQIIHQFAALSTGVLYPQVVLKKIGDELDVLKHGLGQYASRWTTGGVNVVFDGNSLWAGTGASVASKRAPNQVMMRAPLLGCDATWSNLGVSGQTARQMNGLDAGSAADVDAAFNAAKTNVLVLWEGTNSVVIAGRTGAQAATDLGDYITARKAAHAWAKIVVLTTIPRESGAADQTARDANNAQLVAFNAYLVANKVALGIDVICDVRQAGSPFLMSAYTPADFDAVNAAYWNEASPGRVHLNDKGYYLIADYVAAALATLSL